MYCVAATPLTTRRSLAADRLRISMAALIGAEQGGQGNDHEPEQDQAGEGAGAEGEACHGEVPGRVRDPVQSKQ